MGSSGYRLIAGNMCDPGQGGKKDDPVKKPCSQGMRSWLIGQAGGVNVLGS